MRFAIISHREKWFTFSGALVGLSLTLILIFGLNVGIDFTGGTEMTVRFTEAVPNKEELQNVFEETLGAEKGEELIRLQDDQGYQIRSRTLGEQEVRSFESAIATKSWGASIERVNTIGPTLGSDLTKKAFWAISLAIVAIILFVAYAFRKVPEGLSSWKFGMAAIVALTHDVIIIIGFFAILGLVLGVEIDTLFITALLTVLGFSVNDTIVIFDRVRENLKGEKSARRLADICENSIWQSMRRSINTSLSTLIVLITMLFYFVGYPDLFAFFLALSLGFIIGTYSSIFVATPLLVTWHKK